MLVSYRWISEMTGVTAPAQEIANKLTFSGLEVEGVEAVGDLSEEIVVAEILEKAPHPERDKLSVVKVSSGEKVHQVVCGAPNCPGPGGRVAFAKVGATVGDITLEPRKLGGVLSEGMLAAEAELGIGPDDDGILILNGETDAPLGTPLKEALDLEDWIIDVAITPNRPDALSHQGIAREVCLLYGLTYTPRTVPDIPASGDEVASLAKVTIEAPELCPRYAATVVTDVEWRPSPFAVRYRLHNLGLRPISNLVDATNLVMLEYGQPIHAFDLDTLAEHHIVVRRAKDGEKMPTLDGVERVFDEKDLLIADASHAVAIAGVMGGEETGVTKKTTRVLIECAHFNPSSVRRTSKRLKLFTDAAYRFERGMDPDGVPHVIESATHTLMSLAGGKRAPGVIDSYPAPITAPTLLLRPERYKTVIGVEVSVDEMITIMNGIGAKTRMVDGGVEVVPPLSRPDIEREIDLIEEVVRIRGFAEVPMTSPRTTSVRPNRPYFQAERLAKELLCGLGLNEAVSYSFVPGESLSLLGRDQKVVKIANPLSSERASMRTTLIAGLLENLKRAQSRFLNRFGQFEVARTYHDEGGELPREVLRAAAVMYGPADTWVGEPERMVDFFDLKGVVEAFLRAYCGSIVTLAPTEDVSMLHPKRGMNILFCGEVIGFIGELHPHILSKLKLHRGVVAFELELFEIWKQRRLPAASALPEFPPMSRDVALLVDATQTTGEIRDAFVDNLGDIAEAVRVFDVYTGEHVPKDKKSVAFSIIYRSAERTLTDKEVDAMHKKAVAFVIKRFDAVQR